MNHTRSIIYHSQSALNNTNTSCSINHEPEQVPLIEEEDSTRELDIIEALIDALFLTEALDEVEPLERASESERASE